MFILTVKELFSNIKINIERCYPFVMIKGTITDIRPCNSGNIYFTLNDCIETKCTIKCVCWQNKLSKLTFNPLNNNIIDKEVTIKGYIQLYQTATRITLSVIDILNIKESKIQILKNEKETKLRKLGYFNKENKKHIPTWCNIVGLITSKNSAAKHDIINSIQHRFPAKVLLYSTNTQGSSALHSIIKAIVFFNNLPIESQPKAILITRGGGSKEDIDIFNEDKLIIAISESKIPIVTAIGHSTDITLADYAADSYAITPTAAAEILFRTTLSSYKSYLKHYIKQLNQASLNIINNYNTNKRIIENRLTNYNWLLYSNINLIKELQQKIKYTLQDKYKLYLINLKTTQINLTNLTEKLIKKYENSYLLITTKLVSIKPYLLNQEPILNYLTNSLLHQTTQIINQKVYALYNLKHILSLNSYPNILKKGFTLIKDPNTNTIIKNSNQLLNLTSFEIVFYDKIVKINKNNP